jgi:hypothetical protein
MRRYIAKESNLMNFFTFPTLLSAFKVLSSQKDLNGVTFVSIIKGRNYLIYGVTFNPEKNV